MKRIICSIIIIAFIVSTMGCAGGMTGSAKADNGLLGALLGGAVGAAIGGGNKWKTGVIGAGVGAAAGVIVTAIAENAARQVAYSGQPVQTRLENGNVMVTQPAGYDAQTRCKKVVETEYQNGQQIKNRVLEVCEGNKIENRYN